MLKMAADHGVFALIRMLPLLDVLESPVESAVKDVVEASLSGTPVPDEVLILLDDYREASVDVRDVESPVYLQSEIATAAINVSEAQWPRYYQAPTHADLNAESVWQSLDACLARARGVSALTLSGTAFAQEERLGQAADAGAIARSEEDPAALSRHLELLRSKLPVIRSALAELVAEFGWTTPSGPCGDSCDWPSCRSETRECVRHRRFQQTLAAELRRRQGAEPKAWYVQVSYSSTRGNDEPFETISEISAEGFEARKLAYYDDERVEWVDASGGNGGLVLDKEPMPPFVEFCAQSDLSAEEISRQHFEEWWAEARENPVRSFFPVDG
jgi:hypothetical protein